MSINVAYAFGAVLYEQGISPDLAEPSIDFIIAATHIEKGFKGDYIYNSHWEKLLELCRTGDPLKGIRTLARMMKELESEPEHSVSYYEVHDAVYDALDKMVKEYNQSGIPSADELRDAVKLEKTVARSWAAQNLVAPVLLNIIKRSQSTEAPCAEPS